MWNFIWLTSKIWSLELLYIDLYCINVLYFGIYNLVAALCQGAYNMVNTWIAVPSASGSCKLGLTEIKFHDFIVGFFEPKTEKGWKSSCVRSPLCLFAISLATASSTPLLDFLLPWGPTPQSLVPSNLLLITILASSLPFFSF